MKIRWLVALSLFVVVPAVVAVVGQAGKGDQGKDEGWKEVSNEDGVRVWVKEVPGEPSIVRAAGKIDAPPERVLAVLADVAAYKETMPHTEVSELIKREGNDIWLYSVINPPLGSRRDYAVKITLWQGKDGVLGTRWVPANEVAPPPKDGVVRVERNEGSWTLTPLDGGMRTGAIYILQVDPGGSVPKWIIEKTNRSSVPDAFKAVRKAATSKRYANAPSPLATPGAGQEESQPGSTAPEAPEGSTPDSDEQPDSERPSEEEPDTDEEEKDSRPPPAR